MTTIVPPRQTRKERKVLRRVNAYWCAQGSVVFGVLAVAAFIARVQVGASLSASVQLLGLGAAVLALVSAMGAVVFRVFETPREITVRDTEGPGEPQ
ncbi:MAG: hypothetical protein E6K29_18475 [Gammaproteobacteria bacterium]|nr:MAG: hypothetical protein E6K29_18475 [Gammaproteobacteria bacterium]